MDFNADEVDLSLSSATAGGGGPPHGGNRPAPSRGGRRPNPVRRGSATPVPGTRRGSLVPGAEGSVESQAPPGRRRPPRLHELNLFNFDLRELLKDVLLTEGESRVSYHEYAVFAAPDGENEPRTPSIMSDDAEALRMFREAMRGGHGLDDDGNFVPAPKGRLQGRVRQIIADRHPRLPTGSATADGLYLTVGDYNTLGLHSGTLSSAQRMTVESMFWNPRRDTLRRSRVIITPYTDRRCG